MLHIHPKGRRYAAKMQKLCGKNGGHDAHMTAVSYGCESGKREDLIPLIPQSHIDFLRDLPYVCLVDIPGHAKLLCLHGGFLTLLPSAPQLKQLVERDPSLLSIEQMYQLTRDFTIIMPPADLFAINDLIIISGHHGLQALDKSLRRVIIDPGDHDQSCGAALFLPTLTNGRNRRTPTASPYSLSPYSTSPVLPPSPSSSPTRTLSPSPTSHFLTFLGSHAGAPNDEPGIDINNDELPLLSEHIRFFTDYHREFLEAKAHHTYGSSKRLLTLFSSPPNATATAQCADLIDNAFIVRSSYEEALVYVSLITLLHDIRKIKQMKILKKQREHEAKSQIDKQEIKSNQNKQE